jgi:hypothetical protein
MKKIFIITLLFVFILCKAQWTKTMSHKQDNNSENMLDYNTSKSTNIGWQNLNTGNIFSLNSISAVDNDVVGHVLQEILFSEQQMEELTG